MAPPPPSTMPLQQRLLAVAQTLQFAWFIGLSWITFNWNSAWATFSYRTAFVAAAATYGIVVFKAYRARLRGVNPQGGLLALAGDENVQYLAMALVWLFYYQVPLAILPFTVYSIFHVATYTRTNLIPTFQPTGSSTTGPDGKPVAAKASALGDTIGRFVKQYYDLSMGLVAALEIALWLRCLFSAIIFTKGSWILLVIYTIFLRARFAQSSFVQNVVRQFSARVDSALANQSTPPAARQAWEAVKGGVKQFGAATDLRKYTGGTPTQPKKSH